MPFPTYNVYRNVKTGEVKARVAGNHNDSVLWDLKVNGELRYEFVGRYKNVSAMKARQLGRAAVEAGVTSTPI